MTEINWLECVPFKGPESALPTGMAHMPKGITVSDLIKEGSIKKTKSGGILSVDVDEDTYKQLVGTYGEGQILLANANGARMTRTEWYESMGKSDGLKLAIIRELNNPAKTPFKIP